MTIYMAKKGYCATCSQTVDAVYDEGSTIRWAYVGDASSNFETYVVPVRECWGCMLDRKERSTVKDPTSNL